MSSMMVHCLLCVIKIVVSLVIKIVVSLVIKIVVSLVIKIVVCLVIKIVVSLVNPTPPIRAHWLTSGICTPERQIFITCHKQCTIIDDIKVLEVIYDGALFSMYM
jgi:hypothetical protein